MTKLTLTNYAQGNTTVLENEFIDQYMTKANGEYVKVYLLILRHMNRETGMLSVSEMADLLECTEKDIHRALKYWQGQGLLNYSEVAAQAAETEDVSNNGETLETVPGVLADMESVEESVQRMAEESVKIPSVETPVERPKNIQPYRSRKDQEALKELLFVAEQYLGKTLSITDVETITYFFDTLHMSSDLVDYLIEYCVENGHKSMHYIQKVALAWHEQGIRTVTQAKSSSALYNKNCYSVLNAYGIKGRAPAATEIAYIRRWNEEYGFALDIILEACNRTMSTIHQPSFSYTDTILKKWFDKKVHSLKDIHALDEEYLKGKEQKKKAASRANAQKTAAKPNKFNNFDEREYNMSDLERRLVQQ